MGFLGNKFGDIRPEPLLPVTGNLFTELNQPSYFTRSYEPVGVNVHTKLIDLDQTVKASLRDSSRISRFFPGYSISKDYDYFYEGEYFDEYLLTGVVPGQEIKVNSGTNNPSVDLEVLDASTGKIVTENDYIDPITGHQVSFTAESGSDYLIRISTDQNQKINYALSASALRDVTPLQINQTHLGKLEFTDATNPTHRYRGRYSDDFWLEGVVPGQEIQVNLEGYKSNTRNFRSYTRNFRSYTRNLDTYLQLINGSTGEVIKTNNNFGGTRNSQITFTAEENTDYILRASSSRRRATGQYNITAFSKIETPGLSFAYDANERYISDNKDLKSLKVAVDGDTVKVEAETYGNWSPGTTRLYFTGGDNGQVVSRLSKTSFEISGATPGRAGLFSVPLTNGTSSTTGSQHSFEFSWSEVFGNATQVEGWLYSMSSRDGVGSPRGDKLKVIRPTNSTPVVPDIDSSSNDIAGNTFSEARSVSVASNGKTYEGWVGNDDSVDYYAFSLGATNDFKLNLTDLDADVSVQLLNTSGTVIGNYNSSSTGEINVDRELGAGAYRVRVSTASNEGTDYDLNLAVTPKIKGVTGITTTGSDTVAKLGTAQSLPLIGVNNFRSGNPAFNSSPEFAGINGKGYTAVVIDSGIDLDHPAFGGDNQGTQSSRILYHFDFADDDPDGSDNKSGHGTGVASILASEDIRSLGVAPEANLIALKVNSSFSNDPSVVDYSAVEQALQWVLENVEEYNITSVNMSFGAQNLNLQESSIHTTFGDEFEALVNKGVILVGTAGNSFQSSDPRVNGQTGVNDVAADPNVIGVSSILNNTNGGFTNRYTIAPSSQRHPELTNIFAPGENITHAVAVNNDTPEKLSDLPRPGDVITSPELFNTHTTGTSGTSNAAPHVAGMALLAQELAEQQIYRRLDPEEFKDLLYDNGIPINSTNNNTSNNTGEYRVANMVGLARGIMSLKPQGNRTVDISGGLSVLNQNVTTGQFVNVNYVVQNNSYYDAGNVNVRFYLSKDAKIDEQDTRLIVNGSPQKYSITTGYLGGYGSQNLSSSLLLPGVNDPVWRSFNSGVGYIGMKVDFNNRIAETNEENNESSTIPIQIQRPSNRDLDFRVANLNVENRGYTFIPGRREYVNYTIEKIGSDNFSLLNDNLAVSFYLSRDTEIDKYDYHLGTEFVKFINGNNIVSGRKKISLPDKLNDVWRSFGEGSGYIGIILDDGESVRTHLPFANYNQVSDKIQGNNTASQSISLESVGIISVDITKVLGNPFPYNRANPHFGIRGSSSSKLSQLGKNVDLVRAEISVDGSEKRSFQQIAPLQIHPKHSIEPKNWIYRHRPVQGVEIPITIDLYTNGYQLDLDSRAGGDKTLNFTYNLFTGEVKGDVIRGSGVRRKDDRGVFMPLRFASSGEDIWTKGDIEFLVNFF